jgi:hypothetical protein
LPFPAIRVQAGSEGIPLRNVDVLTLSKIVAEHSMLSEDRKASVLEAFHRCLVVGRLMASKGQVSQLVQVLDALEPIPVWIADPIRDETSLIEAVIHDCAGATEMKEWILDALGPDSTE